MSNTASYSRHAQSLSCVSAGIKCNPTLAFKWVIILSEFKQILYMQWVLRENLNVFLNLDMAASDLLAKPFAIYKMYVFFS